MKDLYGYAMCGLFGLSMPICLIAYFTHTEKIVAPIMMLLMIICMYKLRKEK